MGLETPKQFLELEGKPLLLRTLETFASAPFLDGLLLVTSPSCVEKARELAGRLPERSLSIEVLEGGAERQDSVFNGLRRLPDDCRWVMVHDGVRPFATLELLERAWQAARAHQAVVVALPATDTVKGVEDGRIVETLPRDRVWLAQTPQVFRKDLLTEAYRRARSEGWSGTDDASLVERTGAPVFVVEGEPTNIKITTPEDLDRAAWILGGKPKVEQRSPMRIGHGYDVHVFDPDRPLFLGGVEIPHTHGLLGHSDADVLLHAVCDAILGAAALRDIGHHFPDTDPAYKDISSLKLLEKTLDLVREKGLRLVNVDITLVLQKPRIAPHIPRMIQRMARAAGADEECFNIKATSTEKLGFAGREEGVAAYAVALLGT